MDIGFSTVSLTWDQPQTPNGPLPPAYNMSRAFSAFHFPQPRYTNGVHFPGLGYYRFPSKFVRAGAENDIEFYFRTQYEDGLLLFLASDGSQTDVLFIELRRGKPWFMFDCQEGPASFSISESVRFDDGMWHHLKILRQNQKGILTLDSKYSATKNSQGGATVISENTGVYIGGLPKSFSILRQDSGDAKINRYHFIGCIRDIKSQGQLLDWDSALEAVSVEPPMNACPIRVQSPGIFLRGGGYVSVRKGLFTGGSIYTLTLHFRSQMHSGILLFAYGPFTEFAITLVDNSVVIKVSAPKNKNNFVIKPESGELCDGKWHKLEITSFTPTNVAIILDGKTHTRAGMDLDSITSEIFLGGLPKGSVAETRAHQLGVNVEMSFGGCIQNLTSSSGPLNLGRDIIGLWNADLDGCALIDASNQLGSCLSFSSSVVYTGNRGTFNDTTVQPFTGNVSSHILLESIRLFYVS